MAPEFKGGHREKETKSALKSLERHLYLDEPSDATLKSPSTATTIAMRSTLISLLILHLASSNLCSSNEVGVEVELEDAKSKYYQLDAPSGAIENQFAQEKQPLAIRSVRALNGQVTGSAPRFAIEPPSLVEYSNSSGAVIACKPQLQPNGETAEVTWRQVNRLADLSSLRNEHQVIGDPEQETQVPGGLRNKASNGRRFVRSDGSLVITPFKASEFRRQLHVATYRCCLANQFGSLCSRPMRTRAVLDSSDAMSLEVFDEIAHLGGSSTLKCQAQNQKLTAKHLDSFTWFKGDKMIVSQRESEQKSSRPDGQSLVVGNQNGLDYLHTSSNLNELNAQKFLILPNGDLLIRNLSKSDSGPYKCKARHKPSNQRLTSKVAGNLMVDESLNLSTKSREFSQIGHQIRNSIAWTREYSHNFLLCAEFHQMPVASFKWFKITASSEKNHLSPVEKTKILINEQSIEQNIRQVGHCLKFLQVQLSHAADYVCEATIRQETLSSMVRLIVTSADLNIHIEAQTIGQMNTINIIKHNNHVTNVYFGSNVELTCSFLGGPFETIAWFKDSKLLAVSSRQTYEGLKDALINSRANSTDLIREFNTWTNTDNNLKVVQSNVIRIENFNLKNRGVYQCQVYTSDNYISQTINSLVSNLLKGMESSVPQYQNEQVNQKQIAFVESQAESDFMRSASSSIQLDIVLSKPNIVTKFMSNLMVAKGSQVSLQCQASGIPAPRMLWYLDERPIISYEANQMELIDDGSASSPTYNSLLSLQTHNAFSDERFRINFATNTSSQPLVTSQLNISSPEISETGKYKCLAVNPLGTSEFEGQLTVIDPANQLARRMYQSSNVTLVAGLSATIQCPLIGYPLEWVDWYHNDQRLPTNNRQRIEPIKHGLGGQLELSQVDKLTDSGTYTCRSKIATNISMNEEDSDLIGQVEISVGLMPMIDTQSLPEVLMTTEGMRTKLVCSIIQGDHPLQVRWLRRTLDSSKFTQLGSSRWYGYEIMQNSEDRVASLSRQDDQNIPTSYSDTNEVDPKEAGDLITVLNLEDSCQLTFKQISYLDANDYMCVAHNSVGHSTRKTKLVVNVAPSWSTITNLAEIHLDADLGSRVSLDCQAHGHPSPLINWRRGQRQAQKSTDSPITSQEFNEVIISNFRQRVHVNGTLILEQTSETDSGDYMCEVSNGVGLELSRIFHLKVHVPPHFKQRASTQFAQVLAKAELKCLAYGDQPMIVGWRKGDSDIVDLVNDPRHRVVGEQQLSGSSHESSLTISNLTRSDSGEYACIASNEFGTEETEIQLIVQEPPESPILMRPIRATSRQATLTFKAPFAGNSPVKRYAVQYKQVNSLNDMELTNSTANWQQVLLDAPTPGSILMNNSTNEVSHQYLGIDQQLVNLNLCCLKPFTRYVVRVRAVNDLGQSEFSKQVPLLTDEEAIGGPPLDVAVEPTGAHSLKVKWRSPARNLINGQIRGYYIGYKANVLLGQAQFAATQQTGHSKTLESSNNNLRVFETFANSDPGEQYQYKNVQLDSNPLSSAFQQSNWLQTHDSLDNRDNWSLNSSSLGIEIPAQQSPVFTSYLTNLRKKTSYSVIVQAYNKIGAGPRSDQIIVSTLDAAPPMSPILRLVSATYDSAQLLRSNRKFPEISNISTNHKVDGENLLLLPDEYDFSSANEDDDPQSYYTINYKLEERQYSGPQSQSSSIPELSETWQQKRIQRRQQMPYVLTNLRCGSYYLAYMTATNSLGQSEPGETLRFNTMGAAPSAPSESRDFLQVNTTFVILRMSQWRNLGCMISNFMIRFKTLPQAKWTILEHQIHPSSQTVIVSGNAQFSTRPPSSQIGDSRSRALQDSSLRLSSLSRTTSSKQNLNDFIIRNLIPNSSYRLIVEANSDAGSTVAEYEFETSNFSSSLISVNVNGIVASELEHQNSHPSSGKQTDGMTGELDFSFIGNQRSPMSSLQRYTFGVWSLTVVFVVASLFMASATLVLGVRSIMRVKSPRGSRESLISSLLCCSTSASSSSSNAESSHSSSGGTCYQLTESTHLHNGETNYCSLPAGPNLTSSGCKAAAGLATRRYIGIPSEGAEHKSMVDGYDGGFGRSIVTSSSLSTIGSRLNCPTGDLPVRFGQTLGRFGCSLDGQQSELLSPQVRAQYAATLGKQHIGQERQSNQPMKYNMSTLYNRASDTNNYLSFQAANQQLSSEAGTSGYESSSRQDQVYNLQANLEPFRSANLYNINSSQNSNQFNPNQNNIYLYPPPDESQGRHNNQLHSAMNESDYKSLPVHHQHQLQQQQLQSIGEMGHQLPNTGDAYGVLFGEVTQSGKFSSDGQNELLNSLLAEQIQQAPT